MRIITVLADTVQTVAVVDVKVTGNPDDAVAAMVNGGAFASWAAGAAKVMVWVFLLMVKLLVMAVAVA